MMQRDGQGRRRLRSAVLLLVLPGVIGALAPLLASFLPENTVHAQGLAAVLLMLPVWMWALWVPWSVVGGLRTGWWGPAVICGVLGLSLMGRPIGWLADSGPPPPDAIRVGVTNVNAFSDATDNQRLREVLAESDLDVIVVLEKRPREIPGMTRVADNFEEDLPRISHASAVFCRTGFACPSAVTAEFGSDSQRMPLTLTRLNAHSLCLLGAHAPPPVPLDPSGLRPHVERIAAAIEEGALREDWGPCARGDGVVLAGDLNAVPDSPVLALLRDSGLRDALAGAGVFAASWPAGGGWPNLPFFQLDHVLVGEAAVGALEQFDVPGSDHIGVRFQMWGQPESVMRSAAGGE